jgi:hypothetical protein
VSRCNLLVTKSPVFYIFSITSNSRVASNDEKKCPEIYGGGLFQEGFSILAAVV